MQINKVVINTMLGIQHITMENLGGIVKISGRNGAGKSRVLLSLQAVLQYDALPIAKRRELLKENGKIEIATTDFENDSWVFTREFKNGKSSLKVRSVNGFSGKAATIADFIGSNFVDLSAFVNMDNAAQTKLVLDMLGLSDALQTIETEYDKIYSERNIVGRLVKATKPSTPCPQKIAPVDTRQLLSELDAAHAEAAELAADQAQLDRERRNLEQLNNELEALLLRIDETETTIIELEHDTKRGVKHDVTNIKFALAAAEQTNHNAAAYDQWQTTNVAYKENKSRYDKLTAELKTIKASKSDLVNNAKFPVEGLGYENGALTFNGHHLISDGQYRKIAFGIAKQLAGDLNIATFENFSLLDADAQNEIIADANEAGFQIFVEIVATQSSDDSFYIEDGELT